MHLNVVRRAVLHVCCAMPPVICACLPHCHACALHTVQWQSSFEDAAWVTVVEDAAHASLLSAPFSELGPVAVSFHGSCEL